MEFSTCEVMTALKKYWILDHFGFQMFILKVLNLYETHMQVFVRI
jgi:hypothetical protein